MKDPVFREIWKIENEQDECLLSKSVREPIDVIFFFSFSFFLSVCAYLFLQLPDWQNATRLYTKWQRTVS